MKFLLILIVLAALHFSADAQVIKPLRVEREKVVNKYGRVVPQKFDLSPHQTTAGYIRERDFTEPFARSLRLHFLILAAPADNSWRLELFDGSNNLVWEYSPRANMQAGFWSDEIIGDTVKIKVFSSIPNTPLRLMIDAVVKPIPADKPQTPTVNKFEAFKGQSEPKIKLSGASIARMRIVGDDNLVYRCTGFLVSKDILMTNEHCIRSETEASSARVDFDFDSETASPKVFEVSELIMSDFELDFALVRLASAPGRVPLVIARGNAADSGGPSDSGFPKEKAQMFIIQHPNGEPKQVSISNCIVEGSKVSGRSLSLTDFGHLCDTDVGSSGAPVQDKASGKVIGLHHFGFDEPNNLLINQAIRMGLILNHIQKKNQKVFAELNIK